MLWLFKLSVRTEVFTGKTCQASLSSDHLWPKVVKLGLQNILQLSCEVRLPWASLHANTDKPDQSVYSVSDQ